MSLIQITDLTFCYDGSYDNIFDHVSFQIDTDWKLGFTGRNGRGKTTFLNLLMGKYEYQGRITSSAVFEYFPYPVEDMAQCTMDILQTIAKDAMQWEMECELSKLGVTEDAYYRPFGTLSNGERTKALLAALFLRENSFLLIDEPTNHLDMEARERVAQYLNSKKGFLLVSHDRAFLDSCIDHILSINRADIEIQNGNFSTWYYNKQLQDQFELDKNDRLKKDIHRLTAAARQTGDWSDKVESTKIGDHAADRGRIGHLAAKMMKRSKTLEKRRSREIEEKSMLLKNLEKTDSLKLSPLAYHTKRLIELEKVSFFYGEKTVCRDVSFVLEQGDRIALTGQNGSGKSTILKAVCGEPIQFTGQLRIGSRLKISYVPQDASFLTGDLSAYAESCGIEESLFKAILRKLDFSRVQFEKDMGAYSAGQKKKVLIARSLCESAHLYIWDEPLNYIDVLSRMQIEDLITEYQPTLLFVEHDKMFCDTIATKTICL